MWMLVCESCLNICTLITLSTEPCLQLHLSHFKVMMILRTTKLDQINNWWLKRKKRDNKVYWHCTTKWKTNKTIITKVSTTMKFLKNLLYRALATVYFWLLVVNILPLMPSSCEQDVILYCSVHLKWHETLQLGPMFSWLVWCCARPLTLWLLIHVHNHPIREVLSLPLCR